MITKKTVLDKIEIAENAVISVRYAVVIIDDDLSELARNYNRRVFNPSSDLTTIPAGVLRQIANIVWTPATIAAYQASIIPPV